MSHDNRPQCEYGRFERHYIVISHPSKRCFMLFVCPCACNVTKKTSECTPAVQDFIYLANVVQDVRFSSKISAYLHGKQRKTKSS